MPKPAKKSTQLTLAEAQGILLEVVGDFEKVANRLNTLIDGIPANAPDGTPLQYIRDLAQSIAESPRLRCDESGHVVALDTADVLIAARFTAEPVELIPAERTYWGERLIERTLYEMAGIRKPRRACA